MAGLVAQEILDDLGVQVSKTGKCLMGCCPCHGGDNPSAFNLYHDGHTTRGNWYCRTKQCHKIFCGNMIGLVRGVLSNNKGWDETKGKNNTASMQSAINWLCKKLNVDWASIHVNTNFVDKKNFISQQNLFQIGKQKIKEDGWSKAFYRSKMIIPSPYFITRGYCSETLSKFDVGESIEITPTQEMFGRAVVPIFDNEHNRIIGVVGRAKRDECKICKSYHASSNCPAQNELYLPSNAKWRNSKNFARERHLYGLWFAKEKIKQTKQIIIVEGPGDVWKCHKAGFENVVALFGVSLTDPQQIAIEASGAMSILVLLNNDSAGKNGATEIDNKMSRSFNIRTAFPAKKDLSDYSDEECRNFLIINGAKL